MKITSLLSLTLAAAAPALAANAAPRDLTAEEECGELGVTYIPPGEDPSQYRRCEGHPAYLTPSDPNTWTEDDGPYIRSRDEPKLSTEYIFVEIEPRDDGMETIYPCKSREMTRGGQIHADNSGHSLGVGEIQHQAYRAPPVVVEGYQGGDARGGQGTGGRAGEEDAQGAAGLGGLEPEDVEDEAGGPCA